MCQGTKKPWPARVGPLEVRDRGGQRTLAEERRSERGLEGRQDQRERSAGEGLEGEPGASPALSSALLLFCARQARPRGASEGRGGLWAVFPPNSCGSRAGPWHRWDVQGGDRPR